MATDRAPAFLLSIHQIFDKIFTPRTNPNKVPHALPSVPTRMAGRILLVHPIEEAIAAAVAGFPMFALEARRVSSFGV